MAYNRKDSVHKPEQCDAKIQQHMLEWGKTEKLNIEIFNKCIGLQIRKRRLVLDMTQTEFAGLINVTFQQIQKYELGTNAISIVKLMQLCEQTHTDINYFFTFMIGRNITIKEEETNVQERSQT